VAKKIHTLKETMESGHFLIGISSYDNDYRVCWDINNTLGTDLQRTGNFTLFNTKLNTDLVFSLFRYEDDTKCLTYKLISNKAAEGVLVEEWKKIDFLLKISGEITKQEKESLFKKLKDSSLIQTAIVLEPQKQKTAQIIASIQ
jgi:hypothetical protein